MNNATPVDRKQVRRLVVVSAKVPQERALLLEAIRARRGDTFVSETVRAALDSFIEGHFPGATKEAA